MSYEKKSLFFTAGQVRCTPFPIVMSPMRLEEYFEFLFDTKLYSYFD